MQDGEAGLQRPQLKFWSGLDDIVLRVPPPVAFIIENGIAGGDSMVDDETSGVTILTWIGPWLLFLYGVSIYMGSMLLLITLELIIYFLFQNWK